MKYFVLILLLSACSAVTEKVENPLEGLDLSSLPEGSSVSVSITNFIINLFPLSNTIGTGV